MQEKDCLVERQGKQYQYIRRLGKGGGGVTYLVRDMVLNKEWALKVCRTCAATGGRQDAAGNLQREAGLLAGLSHRNIVTAVDYWRTGEAEYLLMEYLRGETLEETIRRLGKIEERQAVIWVRELALAFSYLHRLEKPVYYLDCKPSNIMVCEDGHIKLFDFGAAVRADEVPGCQGFGEEGAGKGKAYGGSRTMPAWRRGTYGYVPPEYTAGDAIDGRCDIYSLGMTFYAMVTGYLPQLPPYGMRPPEEWGALVSPECERVILHCTKEERKLRCAGAQALLRELGTEIEWNRGETAAGSKVRWKRRDQRHRKVTIEQKRSIFYTQKRYAGLLAIGFILLLAYPDALQETGIYGIQARRVMSAARMGREPEEGAGAIPRQDTILPLLAAVLNEDGRKILIQDSACYTLTGALRLEIPREYLWRQSAVTITITPQGGSAKREKTLHIACRQEGQCRQEEQCRQEGQNRRDENEKICYNVRAGNE